MLEPVPLPRAALLLALVAVLVGRGLSQALPGTLAGLDTTIDRVAIAGAMVTQLGAILLGVLAARSAAILVFTRFTQLAVKVASGLVTLFVTLSGLFAALLAHNQLALVWSMALALSVSALLAAAAASTLRVAEKRAVSLVALGIAVTALVHTGARLLALVAADRASVVGFGFARGLSTFAFGLELACVFAGGAWLLTPRWTLPRAVGALLFALAPAIAVAALSPEGWGLIAARTIEQLTSHPDPAVPKLARYTAELWALATVALCVFVRSRPAGLLLVLSLLLLGRSSADVPLGAIFLLNAALTLLVLPPHGTSLKRALAQG